MRAVHLLPILICACGDPTPQPTPVVEPPVQPPVETPHFAADPRGAGPAFFVGAEALGEGRWAVTVHASEAGAVFGYAAHLRFDAAALAIEGEPAAPEALGDASVAIGLLRSTAGDISFGATRRRPSLGDTPLPDDPLLRVTLRALAPGSSPRLELERVVLRTSDGEYVPTAELGGTIVLAGGAS